MGKAKKESVIAGQYYKTTPASGGHSKYIRIMRVSRGQQPKATVRRTTRSGNLKTGKDAYSFSVWLTFNQGLSQWVMPSSYELVEL